MTNTREQAKQNLLGLINFCIKQGGIFQDAASVAAIVNSVHVLDAVDMPGTTELVALRGKGAASDQLQQRIDNLENKENGKSS